MLRQEPAAHSHTAGFDAWLRSRGDTGVKVFTSDDVVDQFGVVKGSYEAVPLPKIKAYTVGPGPQHGVHAWTTMHRLLHIPHLAAPVADRLLTPACPGSRL